MLSYLLNKKITIEKGTSGVTSVLSHKLEYEEYCTTWANVYVRSVDARFDESEELAFTTEFTIRYNNLSKEINNKYRIKYNDQYYKIVEIIETETKQSIKIIAEHFYAE
jgi:head-tail adaptor